MHTRPPLYSASRNARRALIYPFPIRLPLLRNYPFANAAQYSAFYGALCAVFSIRSLYHTDDRRRRSLSPSPRALRLGFVTAAPSPIKPSTKLAARFPDEPVGLFLARANEHFFSNHYLFSLPFSLCITLSFSRMRPPSRFCGKSYVLPSARLFPVE